MLSKIAKRHRLGAKQRYPHRKHSLQSMHLELTLGHEDGHMYSRRLFICLGSAYSMAKRSMTKVLAAKWQAGERYFQNHNMSCMQNNNRKSKMF